MKILVTGATGFIGRHFVPRLLACGHEIVALSRNAAKAASMPWFDKIAFRPFDLLEEEKTPVESLGIPDIIIHLAWPGLPNYHELFHLEQNLPASYGIIKKLVKAGVKRIMVTGTCFEYGMQEGPLSEDLQTMPSNPYGLAKDTLRKFLEMLQRHYNFNLQWIRLFYMYGPGQNPKSLLAQLDEAIDNGSPVFNMSGGDQLRDYLPVEEAARRMALLVDHPECAGIINCCSGKPISVRRVVEQRIAERSANITLNPGYYPYPDYEPMAFWGNSKKLDSIRSQE